MTSFKDAFDELPFPDPEEVSRAARVERENQAAFLAAHPQAFVGVSLGPWLAAAQAAGLSLVPAEKIYTLDREAILMVGGGEPNADQVRQWAGLQEALSTVPDTHMVRWDPCSGLSVKQALANGASTVDQPAFLTARRQLDPSDPRAFDILYLFPMDQVDIWARPWVESMMIDGYPLEFRVFVQDSKVLGVANYYIQRDLPVHGPAVSYALEAKALSEQLIEHLRAQGQFAWMPNYARAGLASQEGAIHGTLDFMVDKDGNLRFLEAGPPFGAGAHPCAFMEQEEISGIALAKGQPVLAFL